MATFFSDTQVGTWSGNSMTGTLTGTVTRSGNTVTLSGLVLALRCPAGQAWGSDTFTFTLNGTGNTFTVTAGGDGYSLGSYSLSNTSFTATTSQTSASISWSTSDGYSGSFSISFPAGGDPPSDGYITSPSSYWDSTNSEVVVTATAAGVNPGSSSLISLEFIVTEQPYVSGIARRQNTFTNGGAPEVSNTQNDWTGTTINILPNSRYYLGIFANNSAGDYRYNHATTIVTVPGALSASFVSATETSISISYTTTADGGVLTKYIEYSLDGGTTWSIGAQVITGSATTAAFAITGLTAGTTYIIQTRVRISSGSTAGPTITATTPAPVTNTAFYGSVNNQSKKIVKLYGGVATRTLDSVTGTIRSGSPQNIVAFDAITFISDTAGLLDSTKTIAYVRTVYTSIGVYDRYQIRVYYTDETYTQLFNDDVSAFVQGSFGLTLQANATGYSYVDLTPTYSTQDLSKQIKKVYGSYNGVTKLVYEA